MRMQGEGPSQDPIVLEVQAKTADYKETKIEVRYGEEGGPIVAEMNIVVMAPLIYKAKYFRVEDPGSPGTALKVKATKAKFEESLERIYRPGIAKWQIDQEPDTVKSKYDIIKNGSLDIEPGIVSEELTRLKADCKYDGTRIIHVHNLRWSYYLAADAGPRTPKSN